MATPGRLVDHIEKTEVGRGKYVQNSRYILYTPMIKYESYKFLVLDVDIRTFSIKLRSSDFLLINECLGLDTVEVVVPIKFID